MNLATAVRQPAASQAPAAIVAAVQAASSRTGVDFSYLMEKAAVESGYRTDAKASTSSATGLYQFIDQTWLNVLQAHGAALGLGKYADAIQKRPDGTAFVADPAMRRQILDLRKDPKVSALLAAEFTRDNKTYLEQSVGGPIGSTDLYLAHFLGAAGAARFISAMRQNPMQPAAPILGEAAQANRSVFYAKGTSQALSLGQVYNRFAAKFGGDAPVPTGAGSGGDSMPAGVVAAALTPGAVGVPWTNTIWNSLPTDTLPVGGGTGSSGGVAAVSSGGVGSGLPLLTVMMLAQMGTTADSHKDDPERQDRSKRVEVPLLGG